MELPKHKKEFLKKCGFVQTYESKPKLSMGTLVNMEKWELCTDNNIYHLYIHFDKKDSNYCNLYYGTNSDEADIFSERNLVSEMKKRGF